MRQVDGWHSVPGPTISKTCFFRPIRWAARAIHRAETLNSAPATRHSSTRCMATARRQASRANLVDVTWLPKKWGKPLKVTRVNGVASKLAAVSAELYALPSKFDKFLFPPAGTYLCRPIAGTTRVGAHGHGIAIDIAAKPAHYWLWSAHRTSEPIAYRNSIPYEIVEIFERQGFIWGGTWYHYDTCTSSTALNSWPLRPNPYLSVAYHFSPPLRLTAELIPQPLDAIPARDFPTSGTTPNGASSTSGPGSGFRQE